MKRRVTKLILFLLLGAIINVAVAWGCVQLPLHSDPAIPNFGLSESDWRAIEPLGYSRLTRVPSDVWASDWRGIGVRGHEVWYRVRLTQSTPQNPVVLVSPIKSMSCGWPLHCLRGERSLRREVAEAWTNGRPLDYVNDGSSRSWELNLGQRTRVGFLPERPIWFGLIINTTLFAAISWLLLSGWREIRRMSRIKRGLCPACAYPVGDSSVCTECGKPTHQNRAHHGRDS